MKQSKVEDILCSFYTNVWSHFLTVNENSEEKFIMLRKLNFKVQFFFLFLYVRERERENWSFVGVLSIFKFAASLALSSLTLLRLYLCVFVSDHVHVCVVCWCFSVMELCRISFLLFWAFQLGYAQQTTDRNEGSLSCFKIQELVEVEFHLYSFKVSKF